MGTNGLKGEFQWRNWPHEHYIRTLYTLRRKNQDPMWPATNFQKFQQWNVTYLNVTKFKRTKKKDVYNLTYNKSRRRPKNKKLFLTYVFLKVYCALCESRRKSYVSHLNTLLNNLHYYYYYWCYYNVLVSCIGFGIIYIVINLKRRSLNNFLIPTIMTRLTKKMPTTTVMTVS